MLFKRECSRCGNTDISKSDLYCPMCGAMIGRNVDATVQRTSNWEAFANEIAPYKFTEIGMDNIQAVFGYLWNRRRFPEFPKIKGNNLLLDCSSNFIGESFAKAFTTALSSIDIIDNPSFGVIDVREGYNRAILEGEEDIYYCQIDNEEGIDIAKKYAEQTKDILKDKIIIFATDVSEDIENKLREDSDFHYRMIRNHSRSEVRESEVIYKELKAKLEIDSRFKYEDEFWQGLNEYTIQVYERAHEIEDQEAFIDDVIERVHRAYSQYRVYGQTVNVECVPKWIPNEIEDDNKVSGFTMNDSDDETYSKTDDSNNDTDSISNIDSEGIETYESDSKETNPSYIKYDESKTVDDIVSECAFGDAINNVLLLAMSTYNGDGTEKIYYEENSGAEIKGVTQLEPVPKFLIQELSKTDEKLDLIIVMATKETQDPQNFNIRGYEGKDVISYFTDRIRECSEGTNVLVIDAPAEKDAPVKTLDAVASVLRYVKRKNKKISLYVDIHGGLRHMQLITDAITSLLKVDKIPVKKAYSVTMGSTNYITDVTDNLNIFNFTTGIDDFINFGNGTELEKFFSEPNKNESVKKNAIVNCIKNISDALSLCQIEKFEKALDDMNRTLDEHQGKDSNGYLNIFIDAVKSDYGALLKKETRTFEKEIEWARKKKFLQQCLSIIESKFPAYFLDKYAMKPNSEDTFEYSDDKGKKSQNDLVTRLDHIKLKDSVKEKNTAVFNATLRNGQNRKILTNPGGNIIIEGKLYKNGTNYKVRCETNIPSSDKNKTFVQDIFKSWEELKDDRNDVNHAKDSKKAISVASVDGKIGQFLNLIKGTPGSKKDSVTKGKVASNSIITAVIKKGGKRQYKDKEILELENFSGNIEGINFGNDGMIGYAYDNRKRGKIDNFFCEEGSTVQVKLKEKSMPPRFEIVRVTIKK